ncbi:MAG: SPOR domain-containing protein [Pseudomonadota bacterium]|uniref:SPOR domain-containing protein n=1 Tax=Providencia TaxID=586 RepID=UPI0024B0FA22
MNKHSIHLFLLSAISFHVQAIKPNSEPVYDLCFVDESSESLCWQQMLNEPNPEVRYDFGVHYANGDGVKQDFTKGRYWIHQAALHGYPLAQYNLGVMFFDGIGGIQSQECAVHWLNKAASENDETRDMAQQALAALPEISGTIGMPKVYRVLTAKECEQLPEVTFLEWATESLQTKSDTDSLLNSDDVEQLKDAPSKLNVEQQDVQPLPVGPQLDPNTDFEPTIPTLFREKMGRYFIQLGNHLLGQAPPLLLDKVNKDGVNHPLLIVADKNISEPEEGILQSDEPLFITRILDHPVGTAYDELDVMAKIPNIVDADPPLEAEVKPTDEATEMVPLLSTNGMDEGSSLKKEETRLNVNKDTVQSIPVDRLPTTTPARITEKTAPQALNLGGELRSASKEHYTLQLSSASQAEPLFMLAKKHQLSNYLVYETQRHGRRWYVLVYGEYKGMTQAKQALKQLPVILKKDTPWIRSLAHVQAEL